MRMLRCSVVSNSLRPHGLWPTRVSCSWDYLSKNTGRGCYFLLQGFFLTQGRNLCNSWLLHCWLILYRWATRKAPLSYTVGSHCLSILYTVQCVYVSPKLPVHGGRNWVMLRQRTFPGVPTSLLASPFPWACVSTSHSSPGPFSCGPRWLPLHWPCPAWWGEEMALSVGLAQLLS